MKKQIGMIIAAAVGVAFTTASFANSTAANNMHVVGKASVKCMGANSCKGKSVCKTANNECKGQNACKGKGMIMTKSKKACEKKGGTVADNG